MLQLWYYFIVEEKLKSSMTESKQTHQPIPIPANHGSDEFPHLPSNFDRIFSIEQVRRRRVNEHGVILEQPTDEIVESLKKDDSRIDVIHGAEEIDGHEVFPVLGTPSELFGERLEGWTSFFLEDAIARKLDEDFKGEEAIAIRSVQASLDGLVSDGTTDVHDIRDILHMGDINGRMQVNIAGFKPGDDPSKPMRVQHRVMQYATQTDWFREGVMGNVEGSDRIFPVILVYDHTRMEPAPWRGYGYQLPPGSDDRATIIRKAYVLDTLIQEPGR